EVAEVKSQIDVALRAARAAVLEGILPGGGIALLGASRVLHDLKTENEDQHVGVAIVRDALQAPIRQIAENAGVDGTSVVEKVINNGSPLFGFDASNRSFGNLIDIGVIEPFSLVRLTLQEAASAAGRMIATEEALLEPAQKGPGA